jgi:hypothetical protein
MQPKVYYVNVTQGEFFSFRGEKLSFPIHYYECKKGLNYLEDFAWGYHVGPH